jgi:hypothetical protein
MIYLLSLLDEARKEIANLRLAYQVDEDGVSDYEVLVDSQESMENETIKLRARVAELEEGLATRGAHKLDCAAHCGQACSCGLAALLAGGEKR